MLVADLGFSLERYPAPPAMPSVHQRDGFIPPGPHLDKLTADQLRQAAEEGRKLELSLRPKRAAQNGHPAVNSVATFELASQSDSAREDPEIIQYLRQAS